MANPPYLDAALDAVARGLGVLPARRGGKAPLGAYKHETPLVDPQDVRQCRWRYGVCVLLGVGIYLLDGDTKEAAERVSIYDTLRVKTARGEHAYFTLPDGVLLSQGRRVAPGIDGKGLSASGTHTIALWAGEDGRHVSNDAPMMQLPQEWIDSIGPAGAWDGATNASLDAEEAALLAEPLRADAVGEAACAAARRWLEDTLLHSDGWGDTFYRAACRLGHFVATGHLTFHEAEDALNEDFNDLDVLGGNPKNVRNSIHNGLVRGTREALVCRL